VKYAAWPNLADTACLLLKIECSVTLEFMFVASNHMLWDDTPCRLIKMIADVSKIRDAVIFRVKQSNKILWGILSLHGVTSRKSGVLNSTAAPNSCSAEFGAVQSSRLLSSSVPASLMGIILPVVACDICYLSSCIDGCVVRFFVVQFRSYSSFAWALFLQLYLYFGHRQRKGGSRNTG
jgi:hypothetical protein